VDTAARGEPKEGAATRKTHAQPAAFRRHAGLPKRSDNVHLEVAPTHAGKPCSTLAARGNSASMPKAVCKRTP
jgi:hypothetical protein